MPTDRTVFILKHEQRGLVAMSFGNSHESDYHGDYHDIDTRDEQATSTELVAYPIDAERGGDLVAYANAVERWVRYIGEREWLVEVMMDPDYTLLRFFSDDVLLNVFSMSTRDCVLYHCNVLWAYARNATDSLSSGPYVGSTFRRDVDTFRELLIKSLSRKRDSDTPRNWLDILMTLHSVHSYYLMCENGFIPTGDVVSHNEGIPRLARETSTSFKASVSNTGNAIGTWFRAHVVGLTTNVEAILPPLV